MEFSQMPQHHQSRRLALAKRKDVRATRGRRKGPGAARAHGDLNVASTRNWSAQVTKESRALELEEGVFTWREPRQIAASLRRSAEASTNRKAPPFRAAMSMLVFYINRAGKNLPEHRRRILEEAKEELRRLYGKR
jgi:hypothetical protein